MSVIVETGIPCAGPSMTAGALPGVVGAEVKGGGFSPGAPLELRVRRREWLETWSTRCFTPK